MKPTRLFLIVGVLLAVVALNAVAWADGETATAWPKKPMFSIRLGSYFTNATGQLRVDQTDGDQGTVIDLENVLNLPKTATVFRARADVRVASWFGVEGEYYRIARSKTTTIDRDINVGDTVFPIDASLSTHFYQNYLDLALKFYLFHRERWDLGLWAGANIHFVSLSLETQPADLSESRKTWIPVPSLGVCFSYSILPRLYLYGKAGYFKYSDSTLGISFDSTRFDISADYYIWKSLGVGVTYEYYDSSLDKSTSSYKGMIANKIQGFQIYGVIGF
jgi:hypothetical protein